MRAREYSWRVTNLLSLVLILSTVSVRAAHAQVREPAHADLFGGYSTLRELGTDDAPATTYGRGWLVSAAVPAWWHRLSLTGEISGHARENIAVETQRLFAVLGGARVGLLRSSRVAVFGQALVGVERFSEPGFTESGVAWQPGAGVDVRLWRRLALRGQADYRTSRQNGATYREVRLAAGAVIGLPRNSP